MDVGTVTHVFEETDVCGICLDEPIVFLEVHPAALVYGSTWGMHAPFPWGRRCLDRSEKARKRREERAR